MEDRRMIPEGSRKESTHHKNESLKLECREVITFDRIRSPENVF